MSKSQQCRTTDALLPLGHIALHQKRKYQPDPTPLAEEVSIPITSSCVQRKSSIVTEASGSRRMRFATRTGTFCGSWQGMPTAHSWSPFGARQSDQTVGPIVKDLASPCKRWEIEDVEGYYGKRICIWPIDTIFLLTKKCLTHKHGINREPDWFEKVFVRF